MELTGIGKDDYAVYNHPERPGIGRDHLGNCRYNSFWISLTSQNGKYLPFTFNDFVKQFNRFYSGTCESCIKEGKTYTFNGIDRAAYSLKFAQRDTWYENDDEFEQEIQEERAQRYYCPLIANMLSNSTIETIENDSHNSKKIPADVKPIDAILEFCEDGHYAKCFDNEYFFKIVEACRPSSFSSICQIFTRLLSVEFIPQNTEKDFFKLYTLSALDCLNKVSSSQNSLYLEEEDFRFDGNKFFDFIFPIPQVWVYVIPKPPPGSNWRDWEAKHKQESLPQRVDFMLTYRGERHIIELDGRSHYADSNAYRGTLADTRWLQRCGYRVHRFANEEISALWSSSEPDLEGFQDLLYSEGLVLEEMVLAKKSL